MSREPWVSIVISSYNYDRFLAQAIESALAQTYARTEVIVVDDGSTDDSRAIIARYGDRIVPLLKENGGQGSAFNAGFRVSRGAIVLFLDSDDVLLPAAVETVVPRFRNTRVTKAHWPLLTLDEHGNRRGDTVPPYALPEGDRRQEVFRDGPAATAWPPTSGNAWARPFLERVLPIPEAAYRVSPDLYLSVLASALGRLETVSEPLSCWRIHGENNTWRGRFDERLRDEVARWEHCFDALQEYCIEAGQKPDRRRWAARSWWHRVRAALEQIAAIVPEGQAFILVDEDQWASSDQVAGRRRVPFPEREGSYWGLPADDTSAITELERLRRAGAAFLVIAWPAFWWLDHYRELARSLRENFFCALSSADLLMFDLRERRARPGQRDATRHPEPALAEARAARSRQR